jgi:hypothetical protein
MKRAFLISCMALAACGGNKATDSAVNGKDKLPTSLISNPRTASGVDAVAAASKPTMDFKDTLHDFGVIHEGETVTYEFGYTNNGKTPLIITAAMGSCGCTVPNYSSEPVEPGASKVMKVTFNSSGKSGHQEKSVTIHANTLRGEHMLYIKADVTPAK